MMEPVGMEGGEWVSLIQWLRVSVCGDLKSGYERKVKFKWEEILELLAKEPDFSEGQVDKATFT